MDGVRSSSIDTKFGYKFNLWCFIIFHTFTGLAIYFDKSGDKVCHWAFCVPTNNIRN